MAVVYFLLVSLALPGVLYALSLAPKAAILVVILSFVLVVVIVWIIHELQACLRDQKLVL